MSEPSIFTRIIRGEIPCHRIYETDTVLSFLDINPLCEGHTLVIPKREVQRLEQLPAEEAADLGRALPLIASHVLPIVNATDYNVLQNNGPSSGQEVPHVHFHIIPRHEGDGLGFRWKPGPADHDKLATLAEQIRW